MLVRNFKYLLILTLFFSSCTLLKKQVVQDVKKPDVKQESTPDEQYQFEYLFTEGVKQKLLGNLQGAISIFSKCLEMSPNSAAAMFELANIHLANGDQTSASLLLEKAVSINPENKWYKFLLAQIYQQTKQYEKAAELYGDLCLIEPENIEFQYLTAVLWSSAEKYDKAIQAYNNLEKEVGLNEQICVEKHQIYNAQNKKKEAIAELQRLVNYNPKEPRYYGLIADYYLSLKDSVKALEYYNKVLEIEPENGFVNFSLASFYGGSGDSVKTFDYAKKGFASEDIEVETKIHFYLMVTSEDSPIQLSDKQIKELLDILIQTNPDDFRSYTVTAEYMIQKGEILEARDKLRIALEKEKSNYLVWERILLIDNDLHDLESMYDESTMALEVFPNQASLYGLKALACLQLEKYEETLEILQEGELYLVDKPRMKIQFEMYKAEAYYKLDRSDEAFKAFDEVVTLDPENYLVLNNYAYYLSIHEKDLDKAERMSSKAVRANPDNSTYLDTYAWVLYKRGDYTLAKFYMESALRNKGNENGVIVEHYGDILFRLGKKQDAVEQWKKALELGDGSEFLSEKIKQENLIENSLEK